MQKKNLVCVKVYFDLAEFAEVAEEAQRAGIRARGLKLRVLKPHGFAGEDKANTKSISKFLKHTLAYWKDQEKERALKIAEHELKVKELEREAAKLGLKGGNNG